MDNLGDDAVYESICKVFHSDFFVFPVSYKNRSESLSVVRALKRKPDMVMLGGGTLIARGPSEGYLKLLNQVTDILRDTRVVVFGPGVSEVNLAKLAGVAVDVPAWRAVLNKAYSISVRGNVSKHFLQDWGVVNRVRICGDPVLYLANDSFEYKRQNKRIAVNFCDIVGRIHGLSQYSVEDFGKALLKKLIDAGWNVHIYTTTSNDIDYMNEFYLTDYKGRVTYFPYTKDIEKAQAFLQEMDVFVGMRLHAIAFAINVCTPFYAIEYHSKTYDFLESLGLQEYSIRTDQLDTTMAFNRIVEIYHNSRSIQEHMFRQTQQAKENFISEANYLKKLLV